MINKLYWRWDECPFSKHLRRVKANENTHYKREKIFIEERVSVEKMGHHCINHCSCARCDSGFNRAESDDVNKEKLNLLSPYSNKVDVYSITYPSDNLKIKGF